MFSHMHTEFFAHFVKNYEFQGSQEVVVIKFKKKIKLKVYGLMACPRGGPGGRAPQDNTNSQNLNYTNFLDNKILRIRF